MMGRLFSVLILGLLLSSCTPKTLDNNVFYLKGLSIPGETMQEKNGKYFFVETYEELTSLIDSKVWLSEDDLKRLNQDFFEDKMIVFVYVHSSQGIKEVVADTTLKGKTLKIHISVNSHYTMNLDARSVGIEIEKTKINKIDLYVEPS